MKIANHLNTNLNQFNFFFLLYVVKQKQQNYVWDSARRVISLVLLLKITQFPRFKNKYEIVNTSSKTSNRCVQYFIIYSTLKSGDTVLQVVEGILRCYVTTLISCKENRNYFNGARVRNYRVLYTGFFLCDWNEWGICFISK